MTVEKVKAGPVATGTDLRNSDLAINSEYIRLDTPRAQYLAHIERARRSLIDQGYSENTASRVALDPRLRRAVDESRDGFAYRGKGSRDFVKRRGGAND